VLEHDVLEHVVDGKIVIGRRVFRTGESQYRLNDQVVRLKEIRDLLMDTGLGIRAYSVIEQGRIGMILSGKPQDRRKLLEEAAGITRYKQRKHLAELKLEDATANRMRLDDIISEVERALRSPVRVAEGRTVPLSAFLIVTEEQPVRELVRKDQRRMVTVSAEVPTMRPGANWANILSSASWASSEVASARSRWDFSPASALFISALARRVRT